MNATQHAAISLPRQQLPPVETTYTEVRVNGKTFQAPCIRVKDATIIVTGKRLQKAAIKDEDLAEPQTVQAPDELIRALKLTDLKPDFFTFVQKIPDTSPKFSHQLEWDNLAVVPITTYKDWLENRIEYDVRKALRKSARMGVTAGIVQFDDALVRGIVQIYNESPTRQGKAFWHYQKDFDTVKHESGTYLEKSEFIGAWFQQELIGFIKMAYVGTYATTIHVISMKKHFDKKATSLLLAKAVEICEQKKLTHLIYGNYVYSDPASSLTEFKRRNGFEKVLLPRYYVPLTFKGKLALKLGLHHGPGGIMPESVRKLLVNGRAELYKRLAKSRRQPNAATSSGSPQSQKSA